MSIEHIDRFPEVKEFFHRRRRDRADSPEPTDGVDGHPVDLHNVAHASEDLPDEVREQGAIILRTPEGVAFAARAFDVLENATADAYGHLELVLPLLAKYSVKSYTYPVGRHLVRGEMPSAEKLSLLVKGGIAETINLCKELDRGDEPFIDKAGLGGTLRTYPIPIVDGTPPSREQVIAFLDLAEASGSGGRRLYVHCEAGKGRTGVMVACYRMAVMGWSPADALKEATNFGLVIPDQQRFVKDFGADLAAAYAARTAAFGRYPLKRPGSVEASAEELAVTIDTAAEAGPLGPSHMPSLDGP